MTELDIINSMLAQVGEAPVTSAESLHPSVVSAKNVLKNVNAAEQGKGWYFNTERNRVLLPNTTGEILIPTGTLVLDSEDADDKLIMRGRVLYDNKNFTTIINRPVKVMRIVRVDYEDLPPTAAEYIRAQAAYKFFVEEDGEGNKYAALLNDVQMAYARLNAEHIRIVGSNALVAPRVREALYPYVTRRRY